MNDTRGGQQQTHPCTCRTRSNPKALPCLPAPRAGDKRRTVLVVFIGGVTYAEVSALRFLSQKGLVNADFVVATTKVVNGSSLLRTLVARSEAAGGGGGGPE